jgi:7,8-dihydroneopterin aldolase/epimerase/oxygenase
MSVIEVNGIRVFAYHGCLPEEARIGGYYRVDVAVSGNFTAAEHSDKLSDTVDYGRVAAVVTEQMAVRSKLIEHVGHRILQALRSEWKGDHHWRIRLTKEHPPIAGEVEHVVYVLEG